MTEGIVRFQGVDSNTKSVQGWFDPATGKGEVSGKEISVKGLRVSGNLDAAKSEQFQQFLKSSTGDTKAAADKVAERADAAGTPKTEAATADAAVKKAVPQHQVPKSFTELGRYTEASSADEVGLGMKGAEVSKIQQALVKEGFDLGGSGPEKNGVDGFWGAKTQAAWEAREAKRQAAGSPEKVEASADADARRAEASGATAPTPSSVPSSANADAERAEAAGATSPSSAAPLQVPPQLKAKIAEVRARRRSGDRQPGDRRLLRELRKKASPEGLRSQVDALLSQRARLEERITQFDGQRPILENGIRAHLKRVNHDLAAFGVKD